MHAERRKKMLKRGAKIVRLFNKGMRCVAIGELMGLSVGAIVGIIHRMRKNTNQHIRSRSE